jgi:hypothetical protein
MKPWPRARLCELGFGRESARVLCAGSCTAPPLPRACRPSVRGERAGAAAAQTARSAPSRADRNLIRALRCVAWSLARARRSEWRARL